MIFFDEILFINREWTIRFGCIFLFHFLIFWLISNFYFCPLYCFLFCLEVSILPNTNLYWILSNKSTPTILWSFKNSTFIDKTTWVNHSDKTIWLLVLFLSIEYCFLTVNLAFIVYECDRWISHLNYWWSSWCITWFYQLFCT